MSNDAKFTEHVSNVCMSAGLKCGWILRTFKTRDTLPLLTLWKSLVIPIVDYCSQLWCPNTPGQILALEKVQMSYLKKISRVSHLDYWDQLRELKILSLQRRRERYVCIYVWKILEGIVPNFGLQVEDSKRNGRYCRLPLIKATAPCRIKTIRFCSMGVNGPRLFNSLPKRIRNKTDCSVAAFKRDLDAHLCGIPDEPRIPGLIKYCSRGSNYLFDY